MKIEKEESSLLRSMALLDFCTKVCKRECVCERERNRHINIRWENRGIERALAAQKEGPKEHHFSFRIYLRGLR